MLDIWLEMGLSLGFTLHFAFGQSNVTDPMIILKWSTRYAMPNQIQFNLGKQFNNKYRESLT